MNIRILEDLGPYKRDETVDLSAVESIAMKVDSTNNFILIRGQFTFEQDVDFSYSMGREVRGLPDIFGQEVKRLEVEFK